MCYDIYIYIYMLNDVKSINPKWPIVFPLLHYDHDLYVLFLKSLHFICPHTQTPLMGVLHYNDVIMGTIASQITSLTMVFSTAYSDADQRKPQSFASLAFLRGVPRGLVNSAHKWPVTQKCSHLMTSSWTALVARVTWREYTIILVASVHKTNGQHMDKHVKSHTVFYSNRKYQDYVYVKWVIVINVYFL